MLKLVFMKSMRGTMLKIFEMLMVFETDSKCGKADVMVMLLKLIATIFCMKYISFLTLKSMAVKLIFYLYY